MSNYILWSLTRLVSAICDRLQNKFDVFLVIEGRRGLGKSTLGIILMRKVKFEMKRRGVDAYKFQLKRDTLFERDEVLEFFHKRQHSGIADEMINVSFNRDFYNEDQKDLIKMINMNRDHNNFFISCVPQFKNLDSQIKNLASIKITVIRRGVAIIHLPNRTVYSPDIWDEGVNGKIERDWIKGGISSPRYSRLTTFRGFLKFPPLHEKLEIAYQKVKDEKRNIIAKGKGLGEVEVELTPFEKIYKALIDGKIKNNGVLEGMMMAHDLKTESNKAKINKQLKKDNMKGTLRNFFSEVKLNKNFDEIDAVFDD